MNLLPEEVLYTSSLNNSFEANPCVVTRSHRPRPLEVEFHHVLPEFEQRDALGYDRGAEPDQRSIPVCRNCHRSIHLVYDAIKAGTAPPRTHRLIRWWAQQGVSRLYAVRPAVADQPKS